MEGTEILRDTKHIWFSKGRSVFPGIAFPQPYKWIITKCDLNKSQSQRARKWGFDVQEMVQEYRSVRGNINDPGWTLKL
jgi:hypothetical protein